jgi:undecaprenyl-diphosphatase
MMRHRWWRIVWWLAGSLAVLVGLSAGLRTVSRPLSGDDLDIVRDVAGHRSAALTAMAHAASVLGRSWVLVPCAVLLGAALWARDRNPVAPVAAVAGIVGAIVLQNLAKALADRPRPPVAHLEHVAGTSFPSGHATEAAAFFLVAGSLLIPRLRNFGARVATVIAVCVIVAAVAASRVYLGVHYPTDVVCGLLLGAGWGVAVALNVRPT